MYEGLWSRVAHPIPATVDLGKYIYLKSFWRVGGVMMMMMMMMNECALTWRDGGVGLTVLFNQCVYHLRTVYVYLDSAWGFCSYTLGALVLDSAGGLSSFRTPCPPYLQTLATPVVVAANGVCGLYQHHAEGSNVWFVSTGRSECRGVTGSTRAG